MASREPEETGGHPGPRTPDPGSRDGGGKTYWRSLDELADAPEFRRFVADEFPGLEEELAAAPNRRHFLKIMGASLGMAGLTACRWPKEMILPFANRPEGRIPGVPQRYATAMELGGSALGLVVTSYDGRPVKVEGNPNHPDSLGAANAFAQAAVLELYDPDRSRAVLRRGGGQEVAATWEDFLAFAGPHFAALKERRGRGLAVLSEATSSPTIERLRERFQAQFPDAAWYEWESLSRDAEREGTRMLFGAPYRPQYHLDRADVIVSLDEDFLAAHPAALRHARQFAARRRAEDGTMNRLYVAEAAHTVSGAAADHRLPIASSRVGAVAARLAAALATHGVAVAFEGSTGPALDAAAERFVAAAAADLANARGRSAVMAGPRQPAEVHALAHAINAALGNAGAAVGYAAAPDPERPSHVGAITALAGQIDAGAVDTLLVLGGNPAYDAPADLDLEAKLGKVGTTVHLSLYDDETSAACSWHLPRAHVLESWADARGWDGTLSVVQPLIDPLYGGTTSAQVLAAVVGEPASAHDLTRETFRAGAGDDAWRQALADGVVAGSAWPQGAPEQAKPVRLSAFSAAEGLELVFVGDASMHDGRFANNAWLQELPDPMSRVSWDNAACLAPATAKRLGVRHGDLVKLTAAGRDLKIAVYVMPGQAEETVVVALGYGRRRGGRVASGSGFDAGALRTSAAPAVVVGASLSRTGGLYELATVQDHHAIDTLGMNEREHRVGELVREATLEEFAQHPEFAKHPHEGPKMLPLWKEIQFTGEHQWAMAIDLSACIGCNACTIACQAENNIPVVGKRQVIHGREMHWIRVDRYFAGPEDAPKVAFQPVACQHCENAPCESVCPVAATTHSEEGLNQMVYNRCVGTRYCSNNCPYKVRRFNFFNYFKKVPQIEKMVYNPEVTIRARGVMEKCTFCIQRIEAVKITAKNERRPLRDGEIVPACAQTCPTEAIVFGDLADPESRVARQHKHSRSYGMLEEIFTKPRNRYLAKLRNPAAGVEEA